jgi:hypothetical protein
LVAVLSRPLRTCRIKMKTTQVKSKDTLTL